MTKYRTAPLPSTEIPRGIPYIIGNEAAERFSFYGMRAILVVFMTQYLMNSSGQFNLMGEDEAKGYFHLFVSAVYFTPFFAAFFSDSLFGNYLTLIFLSLLFFSFTFFTLPTISLFFVFLFFPSSTFSFLPFLIPNLPF